MFDTKRSDFATTIGGFLLVAFFALCIGLRMFNIELDLFEGEGILKLTRLLTVIGVLVGFFCLCKAFLTEGFTFLLVTAFGYAAASAIPPVGLDLAIGMCALFAVVAFMGYREGYLDLTIINALFALVALLYFGFDLSDMGFVYIILGLLLIVAAGVSGYVAVVDWISAQDFILEYEEEVFGDCCCCDDDDCCCDDDDDCCCDDDCDCHKKD
ncbi:MAG: hypothetical protein ACI4Q9_01650 [Candidatus Methanomethylophilaceae archaeon]